MLHYDPTSGSSFKYYYFMKNPSALKKGSSLFSFRQTQFIILIQSLFMKKFWKIVENVMNFFVARGIWREMNSFIFSGSQHGDEAIQFIQTVLLISYSYQ